MIWTRSFIIQAAGVVLMALPATCADIKVESLEITQAIQDATNSVPLVSSRPTAVRAFLGTSMEVGKIEGKLQVFVNGLEVTGGGIPSLNRSFTAVVGPNRSKQEETLNFELSQGICKSFIPGKPVKFRVEVTCPAETPAETGNNMLEVVMNKVVDPLRPVIYFVRIHYFPEYPNNANDFPPPDLPFVDPAGASMLRAVCPVLDDDPRLYRPISTVMDFCNDMESAGTWGHKIINGAENDQLLDNLDWWRQVILKGLSGPTDRVYLFGWSTDRPMEYFGYGQMPGHVGFGNTMPDRFQRTFVHEFGHMVGIDHDEDQIAPDVGWDVGERLHPGRIKGPSLWDVMKGGMMTKDAWITSKTYQAFLNAKSSGSGGEGLADGVLFIKGRFDREGKKLLSLGPVFRLPWKSQPRSPQAPGPFRAEVLGGEGSLVVRNFDAQVASAGGPNSEEIKGFGYFSVLVPLNPEVPARSVRITGPSGEPVYGTLERAKGEPSVDHLIPVEGSTFGEIVTVDWIVGHSSQDPVVLKEIRYQVVFSPNDGRDFIPIAVNLEKPGVRFRSKDVPKCQGTGLIRVLACDGLNTIYTDSTGLTNPGN